MVRFLVCFLTLALTAPALAGANPRIKDIADIEGVRDNQLVGYGLVVGLDGTGDTLRNNAFTRQSLNSMLERFNINVREADLRTGNVAAVMVTAELPPFSMQGSRIDVTISAMSMPRLRALWRLADFQLAGMPPRSRAAFLPLGGSPMVLSSNGN